MEKSLFVQVYDQVRQCCCEAIGSTLCWPSAAAHHKMFRKPLKIYLFLILIFLFYLSKIDASKSAQDTTSSDIIHHKHSSALNGQHLIVIPSKV